MKMKKVLAMALASAMILSLGACGSSSGDKKAEGTSDGPPLAQKQKQAVQVLQEHRRRIPTQSTYVQNRLN